MGGLPVIANNIFLILIFHINVFRGGKGIFWAYLNIECCIIEHDTIIYPYSTEARYYGDQIYIDITDIKH